MSPAIVLGLAVAAALASPVGGPIALWKKPTTLFMPLALGFAGGVLLATISFEMVPKALEMSALAPTIAGFAGGVVAVHALDPFISRGLFSPTVTDSCRRPRSGPPGHRPPWRPIAGFAAIVALSAMT